jgi:hypothetical protein
MTRECADGVPTAARLRSIKALGAAGPVAFLLHLTAFCLAAWIAFRHNIDALFYHFDGAYMIVDALSQRHSHHHHLFELWSNFGQGIGSIQFSVNVKLFPFYWPLYWTKNLAAAKIGVYLLMAAAIFAVVVATARSFSAPRSAALLAGWIIGVLGLPFIPGLVFYALLWVSPAAVLIITMPPIVLALLRPIGRVGLAVDALCGAGLLGLIFYLLAVSPGSTVLIAPGTAPYVAAALGFSTGRAELRRKLLVLVAIAAVACVLRWPWYLFGLFAYTAAHLFEQDFTSWVVHPLFISLLFQDAATGWRGPALVIAAAIGAALSLRSRKRPLRVGAWTIIAIIAAILVLRVLFAFSGNWTLSPIYVELAFWPLYATYAAVAIVRVASAVAQASSRLRIAVVPSPGASLLVPPAFLAALVLTRVNPPTVSPYRLPPSRPPIVDLLASQTAIRDGARFEGRVATLLPIDPHSQAWIQQLTRTTKLADVTGNDYLWLGLWWYRIPTLFEFNQFSSPAMHALAKLTLQSYPAPQVRNVTIYTRANPRILELLGVRYLIRPGALDPIGIERRTEGIAGESWRLSELAAPNLGTYAPTVIEHQQDIGAALDRVAEEGFDPATVAVASDDIPEPLVPAEKAALYFSGKDLRIVASSSGRTLIVVPREYSHCLELYAAASSNASLHRIDGLLTGVLFERQLDAVLAFRIGPLHNPTCRYRDYRDFKAFYRPKVEQ